MKTQETIWKLHHIIKEDGKVVLDQLVNNKDGFLAALDLMQYKEGDLNRHDKSAEYEYTMQDEGIESWQYVCDKYDRHVTIYPVTIEKEQEEQQ